MSSHQREKHLKKVFDKVCIPIEESLSLSTDGALGCSEMAPTRQLSISPERSGKGNISAEQLERIWKKLNIC